MAAGAALAAATVLMTWPQALSLRSLPPHRDVLFSMWRLEWIAHALSHRGVHLFDANIFYPATGTLAYSDATLLEGALTAPLIWAGASPAVAYNIVLLLGLLSSAVAMSALVTYLTGDHAAGVVAALPFAFAPYRFDHYAHLELQWAAWIPLSFLFVHRAVDRRSIRDGVLAGLCVWLQFLSCVYYTVFLAPLIGALAVLLLATDRGPNRARAVAALVAGGALAVVLAIPYARPYATNARALGPRAAEEILRYSASFGAYTAAPPKNLLYGWTAVRSASETRLFPGLLAIVLAAAAFARGRLRLPLIYLALTATAVELSLGLHGAAYRFLYAHVGALSGLRAPARAGILVLAGIGVLAGLGASRLRTLVGGVRPRAVLTGVVAAALLLEYLVGPVHADAAGRWRAERLWIPSQRGARGRPGAAAGARGPPAGAGSDLPVLVHLSLEPAHQRIQRVLPRVLHPHARSAPVLSRYRIDEAHREARRTVHRRAPCVVRAGGLHGADAQDTRQAGPAAIRRLSGLGRRRGGVRRGRVGAALTARRRAQAW